MIQLSEHAQWRATYAFRGRGLSELLELRTYIHLWRGTVNYEIKILYNILIRRDCFQLEAVPSWTEAGNKGNDCALGFVYHTQYSDPSQHTSPSANPSQHAFLFSLATASRLTSMESRDRDKLRLS